jgi:hypothetical protein
MALEITSPLTEINTRNLPGRKGQRNADNLTAICEPIARKCGSLDVSHLYGLSRPVTRIALLFWEQHNVTQRQAADDT